MPMESGILPNLINFCCAFSLQPMFVKLNLIEFNYLNTSDHVYDIT